MLSLGVKVSPIVVGAVADSLGYRAAFLTPLALGVATLAAVLASLRGPAVAWIGREE